MSLTGGVIFTTVLYISPGEILQNESNFNDLESRTSAFRKATAVLFAPSEGSSITMDGTWSSTKLDLSVPMLHPEKRQRV
jgi:hypothetical protein